MFFLYGYHPKTGHLSGPGATGFFVARQSEALPQTVHIYAVSNHHAIRDFSIIRINTTSDTTRLLEFDPSEWQLSDTEDLAAIDVTDNFPFDSETSLLKDDITWVSEFDFASREMVWVRDIGIGDQTFMLGLFADHFGGSKNVPVGRFGLLAAMPDESTPVRLDPNDRSARPAYLNDMRSRTGFSGSPVWVWRTPYDDMNEVGFNGIAKLFHPQNVLLALVGIHRGQFRERTVVKLSEQDDFLQSGDSIEIASAMTVVIPAWEITTLLDKAVFQDQRLQRDRRSDRIALNKERETLRGY